MNGSGIVRRLGASIAGVSALACVLSATAFGWSIETANHQVICGTISGAVECTAVIPNGPNPCGDISHAKLAYIRRTGPAHVKKVCTGGVPFNTTGLRILKPGKASRILGVTCRAGADSIRCSNESHSAFTLRP
jgi:hypothetical protein